MQSEEKKNYFGLYFLKYYLSKSSKWSSIKIIQIIYSFKLVHELVSGIHTDHVGFLYSFLLFTDWFSDKLQALFFVIIHSYLSFITFLLLFIIFFIITRILLWCEFFEIDFLRHLMIARGTFGRWSNLNFHNCFFAWWAKVRQIHHILTFLSKWNCLRLLLPIRGKLKLFSAFLTN